MATPNPKVRVRMYRQGLGDCFLYTFHTRDAPVHILIDCGTLGASATNVDLSQVVADIAAVTGNRLDVLIATHEHKDHVSGFGSQREAFQNMAIAHSWAAWTEDPNDSLGKDVKRFQDDLESSLALADRALGAAGARLGAEFATLGSGIRELLGFRGEVPREGEPFAATFAKTVDEAMRYATRRGKEVEYFSPGTVIERDWLPGVRIYVLGPPRSKQALSQLGEHGSPELYEVSARMGDAVRDSLRFATSGKTLSEYREGLAAEARDHLDTTLPFDPCYRIEQKMVDARAPAFATYFADDQEWRRIDHEWMRVTEELALQLDSATNNTSLALAFELVEDGRVLLHPADAQLGNWVSWQDVTFTLADQSGKTTTVVAEDLLKRTVFYKVGHHASHNATLKEHGLEAMERADLVALIPVDGEVAQRKKWTMPAPTLYKRLIEKTHGRVLRSDTTWPEASDLPDSVTIDTVNKERNNPNIVVNDLYIDYLVR
jgi:hypothetical protein